MSDPITRNRLDGFVTHPKRAVWTLAWPMMMGFMAHAVYHIVDTIFIGRIGPEALAAATFVGALYFVALALMIGFATGITATIARSVGQRDQRQAERTASSALFLGLTIGLVLLITGLALGRHFMPLLGATEETSTLAWQYFQPICIGMPFVFLSAVIRSVLTGEGNPKTPVLVLVAANVINIALDPLLIFTFGLGIRGAAMATAISQVAAFAVLGYIVFVKRTSFVKIGFTIATPSLHDIYPIMNIGLPAAANQIVMSIGMMLTNRVLAVFGQTAVAGFGAGSKVDLIVSLPIVGLAGAAMSIVAMFSGAERHDLVRSTLLYVYRSVFILAGGLGLAAYAASEVIVRAFTHDPHALDVGNMHLTYMVFAYPLMAIGITSERLLQALGHGLPPLIITLTRVIVVSIPGAYIAIYLFEAPIQSIWLWIIAGGLVSNTMAILWVHKYVWKSPSRAKT